ncbi:MAG: HU family DNA-binding protein [Waddliaceae bacterium]
MTKADLIEKISKPASKSTKMEVSKKQVDAVISEAFSTIGKTIKKERKYSVPGFGTFTLTRRKARKGRNPQTGETIKIKASKSIKFKPSTVLKGTL